MAAVVQCLKNGLPYTDSPLSLCVKSLDFFIKFIYNPEFHSFIAKKVARAQEIRDFLGFC